MSKKLTAVIVIHGMGEHMPMDTLRDFVWATTASAVAGGEKQVLFNKVDRLSDGTDLRRLRLPSAGPRPSTDFFEFYWTPQFKPGRLLGLIRWIYRIGRRPFWNYFGNTKLIVAWLQILVTATLLMCGLFWLIYTPDGGFVSVVIGCFAAILSAAAIAFASFGRLFLSDVMRYLSPTPRDITARDAIRERGIALLRRLHEDERYDRIVVVGHSLGSVIGYDLLRLAWDGQRHPTVYKNSHQPNLESFDVQAESLIAEGWMEKFRQLQTKLSEENRLAGVPWKVTDFVTLGSPLTHAETILGSRRYSLADKFAEREFPQCPPNVDPLHGKSFYFSRGFRVADAAAVFASTRWTNIYFPSSLFLGGDAVGGPVGPVFGKGVNDVPVRLSYTGWNAFIRKNTPFLSHILYWSRQRGTHDGLAKDRTLLDKQTQTKEAVPALKSAMRL